jgi:hypothetical protein
MKMLVFFLITVLLSIAPSADAMTKAEAKKLLKNQWWGYYSPSRKATKQRRLTESSALMQCHIGISLDQETHIITRSRQEYLDIFREGDELISVNGVTIDWASKLPRFFWGSIDNVPIKKGDEMLFVVKRDGKEVDLSLPCLGDRSEHVKLMEDAVVAHKKYKGRDFLDKWSDRRYDCEIAELMHMVANISINKGEVTQADYNSYAFWDFSCRISYYKEAIKRGYMTSDIEPLWIDRTRGTVDFLFKYDSPSLARQLESELSELLPEAVSFHAISKHKAFGLNFGGSETDNKFEKISSLLIDGPFIESRRLEKKCERALFGIGMLGGYGTNLDLDRHDYDWKDDFNKNVAGADYSSGRLSGGYYKVSAFGRDLTACFAYFDDQLFEILVIEWFEISELASASLNRKYGQPTVIRGEVSVSTFWEHPDGPLYINQGGISGLSYVYPPIKNEFLRWASKVYMAKERDTYSDSPF